MKPRLLITAIVIVAFAGCGEHEEKPNFSIGEERNREQINDSTKADFSMGLFITGNDGTIHASIKNNKLEINNADSALTIILKDYQRVHRQLTLAEDILSHLNSNGCVTPNEKEAFDTAVLDYWYHKGYTPKQQSESNELKFN